MPPCGSTRRQDGDSNVENNPPMALQIRRAREPYPRHATQTYWGIRYWGGHISSVMQGVCNRCMDGKRVVLEAGHHKKSLLLLINLGLSLTPPPQAFLVPASIPSVIIVRIVVRMEEKNKPDAASVNVSEKNDGGARDSAQGGAGMLEKQTRTRRLFSTPQLFAFSLVYLGTWYSIAT